MSEKVTRQFLLDEETLERSSIVANSLMNRERVCTGSNSYQKEFGVDLLNFLECRLSSQTNVAWLDLCCGEGRALLEAAHYFHSRNLSKRISLFGLDLVEMFAWKKSAFDFLKFETGSVLTWKTTESFDLLTCSHGLHYVGNKLAAISQAASRLKKDGLFLAHLDLSNLRDESGQELGSKVVKYLRRQGLEYESRKHLLVCRGQRDLKPMFAYLGADDKAGANYTGQAAVNSFYRLAE